MKTNKKDSSSWSPRVVFIVLGAVGAWAGFYGFFHGNLWYQGYNATTGVFFTRDTLYFGFLGLVFLVIGLIRTRK